MMWLTSGGIDRDSCVRLVSSTLVQDASQTLGQRRQTLAQRWASVLYQLPVLQLSLGLWGPVECPSPAIGTCT